MQSNSLRPGVDFTESYRKHGLMLYKLAMVHLGRSQDAEEAMQEAFMKLLYRAPAFRDDEHEKAWLIRVMTNHCRNIRRSSWFRRVIQRAEMPEIRGNSEMQPLMELVLALPLRYRSVIHLYYYEDYSVKEIADILHISESAAKMRLNRGRMRLKLDLEGEGHT
ncbi:RNA polymerase sigma factor [Paenibacillus paeoniae]|uniref:RNA polymerase sigma factor n=1 Tax=Paenibacillus paeoniae TaxID=2292705 RepID=A0A371PKF9_9BACL|nr:RNA polymerase sigma factor [Paenibacillus paeoniae]REK76159.1 RNA polymerase sigma factor [Paenibacillus paeoniae]